MIGAYPAAQPDQNVARVIDQSVKRARCLVAVENVRGGAIFSHAIDCASGRVHTEPSRVSAFESGAQLGSDLIDLELDDE